ncbi:MAG: N-acetyltransferase [Clostridiales bacterium]|nr:N-acetyltransferase [Clostridiales bacterium]
MDFIYESNRIYKTDDNNNIIAEVTYPSISDSKASNATVNINHTFVDNSLRGQGIAGQLMEAVATKLREENKKAILTCSYAISWFERHTEYSAILADRED